MTFRDALPNIFENDVPLRPTRSGQTIQYAQEKIYQFLLEIVKKWPPEEVLLEFKRLFIFHVDSSNSDVMQSLYEIVFSNNEEEFRNTLKRACYILVNNWDASRHYKPIQELLQVFTDPSVNRYTASPTLKRLRQWLHHFVESKDYEELQLFVSRYDEQSRGPWSSRYTSYLLVPQYIDLKNPIEQREAARALAKQLRDRFKFDLAMYITRSQSAVAPKNSIPKNPTALGDEVLRLIKAIVARRGPFSYANLANIFLNQIQGSTYLEFKESLKKYLIFSVENPEFVSTLQARLTEKLDPLYEDHHPELITSALILRTCNRLVEYLTTENREEPSPLFILLLSQGNPITLVIVLLKIILICKHARTHLEARIADLITYYQHYPEDECSWVVNFLEIFNVTFAIHAENVQYNLVKMKADEEDSVIPVGHIEDIFDPDRYRIFSQMKYDTKVDALAEVVDPETLLPDR